MTRLFKQVKSPIVAGIFFILFLLIPACDFLEECGTCEFITVDADGNRSSGTPMFFCGDDLQERQNSSPVTVGGVTTYWECY